jgi:iron complex transport system substrate-binding protein
MKNIIKGFLAGLGLLLSFAAHADIVVTDLKGREVKLAAPAKHVLLGFYYEDFIAVVGPKAVDKIAAVSLVS